MKKIEQTLPKHVPESFAVWARGWRYFFWFLGVILLLACYYAEENWRGEWAWAREKQKLKARGERIDFSDFVPRQVPDSQNFAATPLLGPLFGISPASPSLLQSKALIRAQALATEYDSLLRGSNGVSIWRSNTWVAPVDLAGWRAVVLKGTNQTVLPRDRLVATNFTVPEAAAAVLDALADCEPVFEELHAACKRPYSRFNLYYQEADPWTIRLPHLAVLKQFSQLAALRTAAELALGRKDAAFEDVMLMLRLADAARLEPILISHLVRVAQFQIAIRPIAEGMSQWSEPQLQALQEALGRFDFCADGVLTLRGECFFFGGGMVEYVRRAPNKFNLISSLGGGGSGLTGGFEWVGMLMTVAPQGWFGLEHLNFNRMFQQYLLPTIDATNRLVRPSPSRRAESGVSALLKHSAPGLYMRHRFFCGLMLPSISSVSQKMAFAQTAADTAALACALERYRKAHGQYPDALASLAPQFVQKLPHDVINGEPLKYRRTQDGQYVLYSVGWNETDDGGTVVLNKGGWTVDQKHGDWVWRPGK
jgi:hypothetical protein